MALLALASPAAQAIPSIQAPNGVVNASSELPDIAQGSWFVIFGTGLGPTTISVQNGMPYQQQLSKTSVAFAPQAGGPPINAWMYYTLSTQVAGMIPSSTPTGAYNVTVTYNGETSSPVTVNVVAHNFGFATQTSNGQGPAQATYGGYNLNRFTSGNIDQWSIRPAQPGDTMVLWGTGLGPDPASDTAGGSSGDQTVSAQVSVIVQGIPVTPAYAGRSSGSPGLDQINFTVPSNVTPSCFVSLQVSAGGRISNFGSIAVATAGQTACTSPVLTEAQLHTLDLGGTLTAGVIQLGQGNATFLDTFDVTESSRTDMVAGWFGTYRVDELANSNLAVLQPGACFLMQRAGTSDALGFGSPPAGTLDAGAQLTLSGPNASGTAIPLTTVDTYLGQTTEAYLEELYSSGLDGSGALGSPTLTAGTYSVAGTGGADVGAFSSSVTLPGDFAWTNQSSIPNPIPRSTPLTVTWRGNEGGSVVVLGGDLTRLGGSGSSTTFSVYGFVCTAEASAGALTVPANILRQVTAVGANAKNPTFGMLFVIAAPAVGNGQTGFTVPLSAGGTIQVALGYEVAFDTTIGYN